MADIDICFFGYGAANILALDTNLQVNAEIFSTDEWVGDCRVTRNTSDRMGPTHRMRPLIALGLAPSLQLAASRLVTPDNQVLELFQWSGAEYMQYGFSIESFMDCTRRVLDGATQPLPVIFGPKTPGLLRVSSELRHWLENRRTNMTGMRDDFRRALTSGIISPFYLKSLPAMAEEHYKMVKRLWVYEDLATELSPKSKGIAQFWTEIEKLESAWSSLELKKVEFRNEMNEDSVEKSKLLQTMCIDIEQIIDILNEAITASRILDAAVQERE